MKQQLKDLKVLHNDAQIVRDRAKTDLQNLEKKIYADRRARDLEMQSVKREADEKRLQQEQFQRRIVCISSAFRIALTAPSFDWLLFGVVFETLLLRGRFTKECIF
jgi:hypothetical protein